MHDMASCMNAVSRQDIAEAPPAATDADLVLENNSQLPSISQGPELTVVVPTFNERDNIGPLIDRLRVTLTGIKWEVIFVDDDSKDGTTDHIRSLAQADTRVRCLLPTRRRGLAKACIEGILASAAPYLAVIDADLQHDEAILPQMLEALQRGGYDVAIGSRYVAGGSVGGWDPKRIRVSQIRNLVELGDLQRWGNRPAACG